VLAALKISGGPISGVTLRKELRRCLGAAGGTQRIYRLLKTPPPLDASEAAMRVAAMQVAAMQAERDAAVSRAELAELRERAAVDRTANQIHELRQRLRAVGIDPFK
jgi:hypothetical protein